MDDVDRCTHGSVLSAWPLLRKKKAFCIACLCAVPVGLDPAGEVGARHLKVYTAPGRKFLPHGWRQMEPIPPWAEADQLPSPRMNTFSTAILNPLPPIDSSMVVEEGPPVISFKSL